MSLSALGVAKLNLFNLQASSGELADDVSQRLGLVAYDGVLGRAGPDRAGQDAVRVISIDEQGVEALRSLGWKGWPPGYDNLAILIEDLTLRAKTPPRAVFLDLVITGRNAADEAAEAELATLISTLGGLSGAQPSDLFGRPQTSWGEVKACRRDPVLMLACMVAWDATPLILARANDRAWRSGPEDAQARIERLAVLAPIEVDDRNYPLLTRRAGSAAVELYPATALYAAHCLSLIHRSRSAPSRTCGVKPFDDAYAAALTLRAGGVIGSHVQPAQDLYRLWGETSVATIWSGQPHPDQARLLSAVSGQAAPECGSPAVFPAIHSAFARKDGPRVCESTLWMGYDRLAAGYGIDDTTDYPILLEDRLLLVGARLYNDNDWVRTPLHGALPGVFYHAMTLDNLIEMGAGFRRSEPDGAIGVADLVTTPLTFILVCIAAYAAMGRRAFALARYPALGGRLALRASAPWYLLVSAAILIVAAVYVYLTQRWWSGVVVNWLGVGAVVFGAMGTAARFDLIQDVEAQLQRGSGANFGRAMAWMRNSLDIDHETTASEPRIKGTGDENA